MKVTVLVTIWDVKLFHGIGEGEGGVGIFEIHVYSEPSKIDISQIYVQILQENFKSEV